MVLKSRLAKFLVKEWAWGYISPQKLQKMADLELADIKQVTEGCTLENASPEFFPKLNDLEKLAGIGTHGSNSNHCNRDLAELLKLDKVKMNKTKVKVKKVGTPFVCVKNISLLWPHMLFYTIYTFFQDAWNARIMPSEDALEAFWNSQHQHPNLPGHPMTRVPGWKRKAVPIAIHGDQVPVTGCGKTWAKSMLIISWCSMLGRGSTVEMNFLILSIMAALLTKFGTNRTMDQLWRGIVWSLTWLQKGVHPSHDEYGRKYDENSLEGRRAGDNLCGEKEYFGVLWGSKQDLEHLWKEYGFPCYNWKDDLCGYCPCNSHAIPWKDFRVGKALWIDRVYTRESWAALNPKPLVFMHQLLALPGVSIFTFLLDLLHIKYLGTDQYFNASVLWLLCYMVLPGSAEDNMTLVWQCVERYYVSNPSGERYSNMKLSMFTDPASPKSAFPKLKGKGAEIRALTPALHVVWCKYMKRKDPQHEQIATALASSVKIDKIMEESRHLSALPADSAKEFKAMVFSFLILQNALGKWYPKKELKLFLVTPKSHFLAHVALTAQYINPRLGFCFQGEDYMGKMKAIASLSARGNSVYQVSGKTVAKYCRALQLVLEDV